jgi:hypothetical protein
MEDIALACASRLKRFALTVFRCPTLKSVGASCR